MGVQGLVSFINSQPIFVNKHQLHDTKLVIDANNLYHFIYYHHKVPYRCGGDYHLFAVKIKLFFKTLEACNIAPFLVFDGGYETDHRKLKTSLARARQRINMSQSLSRGGSGRVTPALAGETFIYVLNEIGVPYVVGDFEADGQIALLANEWNCPVMSNDSDFYIFDLTGGFVTMDHIDFTPKTMTDEKTGENYTFFDCDIYYHQNFIDVFPGLNKCLLPLFSTLSGNDYINCKEILSNFFGNLRKAPDSFGQGILCRKRNALFLSLLNWLHNQTSVEEAVEKILTFLKTKDRDKTAKLIKVSVESYTDIKCSFSMKEYFETGKLEFYPSSLSRFYKGNPLPEWFVEYMKKCKIPVSFLNTMRLRRHIHLSQIEEMSSPSVYRCSAYIRQVLYGMLLLHDASIKPISQLSVEEYDRVGTNYQKNKISPVFELPNFGPLPELNAISSAALEVRCQILLLTLGVNWEFVEQFPTELRLTAGTIVCWVKYASPRIHKPMVSAVLVCSMYLWIKLFREKNIENGNFIKECLKDERSISKLIEKTDNETLTKIAKNLVKFCGNPSFDWNLCINTPVVHNFNQFQVCLLYASYLNKLLLKPLHDTSPYLIFCGTFLCNLFLDINQRVNPQAYIQENLLESDTEFSRLFAVLDEALHSVLESSYGQPKPKKSKKNRGRKKKSCKMDTESKDLEVGKGDCEAYCMITNRFSTLNT